jgi:hypothetical protein
MVRASTSQPPEHEPDVDEAGDEPGYEPGYGDEGDQASDGPADKPPGDDLDQLGIPLSREPTIDDVRGDSAPHRRLALGCSLIGLGVVAAFWLWRLVF